ncbi:MAG: rod-binding protein [Planctomycetota bacterium]
MSSALPPIHGQVRLPLALEAPGFRTDAPDQLRTSGNENSAAIDGAPADDPMKDAFQDFVGQTLFGSMLATMRESVGKPAYFHGGRAEEVFQKQLDQNMVEAISDASAETIVEPMYDLFQLQRHR